jgi:hypothetical protein
MLKVDKDTVQKILNFVRASIFFKEIYYQTFQA